MCPTCLKIPEIGMKKTNNIKVVSATIQGPLHLNKNLPCQDFCKHSTKSKNFVAIVSDGAGSAKFGKIGAKIACDTLIDLLKNSAFDNIQDQICHAIEIARAKVLRHRLNKTHCAKGMMDFSATIVGVVYYQNKGIFFHIGDGAALALSEENYNNFIVSPPSNGNFSCETFFYTQENWKENLRFTSFENADAVFLMSDGLTNFSFSADFRNIEKNFLLPIHNFLNQEKSKIKARRALANTLNNSQARKLNSDDKTLLWARL